MDKFRFFLRTATIMAVCLFAVTQSVRAWEGSGTSEDPYLIGSTEDWLELGNQVHAGNSYSGVVFRMARDIDASSGMVGTETTPFSGTFDGDGYTLTFNSGNANAPATSACAPFCYVSGATIRHLRTTGIIYTNAKFAAGIVSNISGAESTYITDCHTTMTISSAVNGDGTHGGLVAVVSQNTAPLYIEQCSFTGKMVNTGMNVTTSCGGFVGFARTLVTVTDGIFAPANSGLYGTDISDRIDNGVNFVRMSEEDLDKGTKLKLTDCYTTLHMSFSSYYPQGTFLLDRIYIDDGCSYEFIGEPDFSVNGKSYYKSGCQVRLTVQEGTAFNHWEDGNGHSYISDPWRANGIHQLKDVNDVPVISIKTSAIPSPITERTLWGVTYRYLSRKDYHYYVSDEDMKALGWTFRNADGNANLIKRDANGKESLITAITGYNEGDYNSDGVQIHNDLVSLTRDHTHLGLIAPRAFKGSTKLKTLYFKDTDASTYNALLPFQFIISEAAFEGCTNFQELKMMQYTTKGDNHWEALKPDQVYRVADDAFTGCTNLSISAHNQQYQNYMGSETWRAHRDRFIIYEATVSDFTVEGVKYHYYRKADETGSLRNNDEGKTAMMEQIRSWNADYQQFNAADLLQTNSGNVYYCYVTGVDNGKLDSKDGVMRIYNDPGSTYNYKNIALGRNAIAGNTHVKAIEFWQTNGDADNSYSDLKMVIPNGALKGCTNLKELRLFYYVENGEDHWTALGPKDVIPGNNIFGVPSLEERLQIIHDAVGNGDPEAPLTAEQMAAIPRYVPADFKIIVASELYTEFMEDPNWLPYVSYIEPADYMPSGKENDFTKNGLTYSYMSAPSGIAQTSQVVSQDVSWWTVPRIGLEVLLYAANISALYKSMKAYYATLATIEETKKGAIDLAQKEVQDWLNSCLAAKEELQNQIAMKSVLDRSCNTGDYAYFFNEMNGKFVGEYCSRLGQSDNVFWYKLLDHGIIAYQKPLGDRFSYFIFQGLNGELTETQIGLLHRLNDWMVGEFSRTLDYISLQHAQYDLARANLLNLMAQRVASREAIKEIVKDLQHEVFSGMGLLTGSAGLFATNCWGGSGSYNGDLMNKGMRESILSNIHQVGLVGGGYVITTPQKNIVYHTYIKSVGNDVENAVIYAGFDNDKNVNTSNRTVTFARDAFRNKTNLKSVRFHEIDKQSSNTGMPLLFTLPDSAFVGCNNLTEFSTLMETRTGNETRALGPENFILAGDSIFVGKWSQAEVDSLTAIGKGDGLVPFSIIIDPTRKQDFLANESWAPLERFFVYRKAAPAVQYNEYGAQYAYAYEQNSIKKEHKVQGHLIEHTAVIGADNTFLEKHQGTVKLCNDIGIYNNFQLDEVMPEAFKNCSLLRSVTFTDLKGRAFTGDTYTGLQMHIGDRAFEGCSYMKDITMLYMVTDGLNHIDPITPQMVTIGKNVFEGSMARIKMMPQQVAWFEADSAWVAYKDRFTPCIVKLTDEGVKAALKDMAFYDAANTGLDQSYWSDYIDYSRIEEKGFDWLNNRFREQKDKLRSFADFRWFESVSLSYIGTSWFEGCTKLSNIVLPSTIRNIYDKAFKGCTALEEIEIPAITANIYDEAFAGCTRLKAILVRGEKPATLGKNVFDKHFDLSIIVPVAKINEYKAAWSEYADYIIGDNNYPSNKVVTVDEPGQLASKLGLTVTKQNGKVRYLNGQYAKYDSLTVRGPLNGEDLGVIRYLAGADAYDSDPTDGQLRYLNLWNADIKKDTENSYNGNFDDEYIDYDNKVGDYLFENCAMIETVILPKSATYIGENVFEDAKALKRVCVGLNTTGYDTDLLQNIDGIEELALLTTGHASNDSFWSDPWEGDIAQVWTLPSQTGNYMGDTKLTKRAHNILAPLNDENVMLTLAEHGYYFPAEYMYLESAEDIFNDNLTITDLSDFNLFMNVKHLENTFGGMNNLKTIRLPYSIETISSTAFSSCISLDTIYVSCDSVPVLAEDAFAALPNDFKILVPKNLCKLYRTKWAQYADHINPNASFYATDNIITVTLTEPNTLAEKLGLKQTIKDGKTFYGGNYVTNVTGNYSRYRRLKVIGPISGADLDVLDYISGYCKWAKSPNYSGRLEYLDLYDAQLTETDVWTRGYRKSIISAYQLEEFELFNVVDNTLPMHALLRAYNLKTLILPKTCKKVNERALQECEGLETLVLGDDMEDFNWNAIDDDAMLTRMYILAKKKVKISTEWAVWRWLCNNYNPTFDAFYVCPSLYDEYLKDEAYTGSSWQRTNNISKGMFSDDASFRYFASHTAATFDDLVNIFSIDGWSKGHEDVRDLTALGFTAIDSLRAADIQPLTKLEKVILPVTLEGVDMNVFANAPNLRYVDMMSCDSTLVVEDLKPGVKQRLGINANALVYVPSAYGETSEPNVVWMTGTDLRASHYDLYAGWDYSVPYAFTAQEVTFSRPLPKNVPATVCLPYRQAVSQRARTYHFTGREGNTLVFQEVTTSAMEPLMPYLVMSPAENLLLSTTGSVDIPAAGGTFGKQVDVYGLSLRGTLDGLSNIYASELGALTVQPGLLWSAVSKNDRVQQVLPFTAYLLAGVTSGTFGSSLQEGEGVATDIDSLRTVDADGTERYYDLSGRLLPGKPDSGVFIHNGMKYAK